MKTVLRGLYRFIGLKFLNEPCPVCRGSGRLGENVAICPMTCDYCYGSGKKANLLVMLAWVFMMIALTIVPFAMWWLW